VRRHIESTRALYEKDGVTFSVEFSSQKPSTDTIAVDMDNHPFRDRDGALVFRPGGHGSLLENLCDLSGDVLFIKNIDNVLPDRIKEETLTYKKSFGGLLNRIAEKDFCLCGEACEWRGGRTLLTEMIGFMKERLFITIPDRVERHPARSRSVFLFPGSTGRCGFAAWSKTRVNPEAGPSG